MVITSALFYSTKPGPRLCTGSNPARVVLVICNGKNETKTSLIGQPFHNLIHNHHHSSHTGLIYILKRHQHFVSHHFWFSAQNCPSKVWYTIKGLICFRYTIDMPSLYWNCFLVHTICDIRDKRDVYYSYSLQDFFLFRFTNF